MLLKIVLLIVAIMGLAIFIVFFFNFIPKIITYAAPVQIIKNDVAPLLPPPQIITYGLPSRLKIPKIDVDAAVEYVGLTKGGAVGTPKGPDTVAWFKLGPRPGDNGSAVISGHYGQWKNGGGSVFDNLNKLMPGDIMSVEDERGVIDIFVVRKLVIYAPETVVSDVFASSDGKSHLNLITCEGVWSEVEKTYSGRLVVFADKE